MEGELKFSNRRIEMVGDKHVLVTSNNILRLAPGEDIGAWKRRLIVLQTVPPNIERKVVKLGEVILAEERDAVFSKLMNAAYLASVELHRDGDLIVPERNTLLGSGGVVLLGDVGEWVTERVSPGESFYATNALFNIYSTWCKSREETPITQASFEKTLRRLLREFGIDSSHSILDRGTGTQRNGYRGLEVAE